jgi:hypothetical protein
MNPAAIESQRKPSIEDASHGGELNHRSQTWYLAYMEALFESDRKEIVMKIQSAERLVALRERELFQQRGPSVSERGALARAAHALRALQSCQRLPGTSVQGNSSESRKAG